LTWLRRRTNRHGRRAFPGPRPAEGFRPGLEALADRVLPSAVGLDPAFVASGGVVGILGQPLGINTVAVQPDGKIVVVGDSALNPGYMTLARYNPDGLDAGFGVVGTPTAQPGGRYTLIAGVALQADGRLVVAAKGVGRAKGDQGIVWVWYNPDGGVAAGSAKGKADGSSNGAGGVALLGDGTVVITARPGSTAAPVRTILIRLVMGRRVVPGADVGPETPNPIRDGPLVPSPLGLSGQVPWADILTPPDQPPSPLPGPRNAAGPAPVGLVPVVNPVLGTAAFMTHALIVQSATGPAGAAASLSPDADAAPVADPGQAAGIATTPLLSPSYLTPDPSPVAPGGRPAGAGRGAPVAADAVFEQLGGLVGEGEDEARILAGAAEEPAADAGEGPRPTPSALWWVSACLAVLLVQHARAGRYANFSPPPL
jgi:hypothetical protein